MLTYKGDVYSDLRENWKEPSSSTISTEALLNDDSNEETLNINNVCQQLTKINEIQIIFKYYSAKSNRRCYGTR